MASDSGDSRMKVYVLFATDIMDADCRKKVVGLFKTKDLAAMEANFVWNPKLYSVSIEEMEVQE